MKHMHMHEKRSIKYVAVSRVCVSVWVYVSVLCLCVCVRVRAHVCESVLVRLLCRKRGGRKEVTYKEVNDTHKSVYSWYTHTTHIHVTCHHDRKKALLVDWVELSIQDIIHCMNIHVGTIPDKKRAQYNVMHVGFSPENLRGGKNCSSISKSYNSWNLYCLVLVNWP